MRSTSGIDGFARRGLRTIGRILSGFVREGPELQARRIVRNGFRLFTPKEGAGKPRLQLVNELRDER